MPKLKQGDYVVATKYSDGHPGDHFCVGWFDSMTNHDEPRYNVVDSEGKMFRQNGFRRVQKISKELGEMLVSNFGAIENGGVSVWTWVRKFKKEINASQPV